MTSISIILFGCYFQVLSSLKAHPGDPGTVFAPEMSLVVSMRSHFVCSFVLPPVLVDEFKCYIIVFCSVVCCLVLSTLNAGLFRF